MDRTPSLEAANGLTLHLHAPHWRVAWREPDWLGPLGFCAHHAGHWYEGGGAAPTAATEAHMLQPEVRRFEGADDLGTYHGIELLWHALLAPLRTTVRAYSDRSILVFRTEATSAIDGATAGIATGAFAEPAVSWPYCLPAQRLPGGVPEGTRTYGHQYTEFALPVSGDADCAGLFCAPHRPLVVEPLLWIAADGRTLMLAPLDHFHEQIIAMPAEHCRPPGSIRCGWHGDLADVPAGFATELAVWAGEGPRAVLSAWAELLRQRHGTRRLGRYADDLVGKLSYWTDNGAVYYYRTEPDCDYATTLERVVGNLQEHHIPVGAVQIDSWFYPHVQLRPVSAEGAAIVPPSGMMCWEPRDDLFPDGFDGLRRRCGHLPLAFHSRHFSTHSPYFETYRAWHDGEYAHPMDAQLYDQLMAQAARWGAITYEQDWMVESFLGVRGLRAAPGRARDWQEAMDHAAGEHGLTLQWCMSTPADFMQSVTLDRLASIRTSGDYRYMFDNGLNWVWFLHTNALARALGLWPFKDVFLSHGPTSLSTGEPYAEIEALLSALSAGPVGIGDQLGHTRRELVMRTCREDGVLVKPDMPIAAIDRCFHDNAFLQPALLVGETASRHPAGRWTYVATFNAFQGKQRLRGHVALDDLGNARPEGPVLAFDWRRHTWTRLEVDGSWDVGLDFQDWDYRILCPLLPGDVAVFGDVGKYATVGDKRVARIAVEDATLRYDVLGAPGTVATVHGWAAHAPRAVAAWAPGAPRSLRCAPDPTSESWEWDPANGGWSLRVAIRAEGRTHVTMTLG